MTLKPQCDCSTCACANAPGRSGYCLNCEVTDSGAEGSHAQHTPTPGPWYATTLTHDGETYSHVQSASINEDNYIARVDVMDEQGEANAALIAAAPALLEALRGCLDLLEADESDDEWAREFAKPRADAARAAIAAAERPGDTR